MPYPYPHEQVGKDGLEVPKEVIKSDDEDKDEENLLLVHCILKPGDVLYLPRGYVHEARATTTNQPSFHVTAALATHDWSLAGLLSSASQKLWTSVIDYRKALPRQYGMHDWKDLSVNDKERLQEEIEQAIRLLRKEVTAEAVHNALQSKYEHHNQRALSLRQQLMEKQQSTLHPTPENSNSFVGRQAAEQITMSTQLRVATDKEKAIRSCMPQERCGLHVRDYNYEALIGILQRFKSDPSLRCPVSELKTLLSSSSTKTTTAVNSTSTDLICDLTLLCFARQCVELGALAIVMDDS